MVGERGVSDRESCCTCFLPRCIPCWDTTTECRYTIEPTPTFFVMRHFKHNPFQQGNIYIFFKTPIICKNRFFTCHSWSSKYFPGRKSMSQSKLQKFPSKKIHVTVGNPNFPSQNSCYNSQSSILTDGQKAEKGADTQTSYSYYIYRLHSTIDTTVMHKQDILLVSELLRRKFLKKFYGQVLNFGIVIERTIL